MQILYSPQVSNKNISYSFRGEEITVSLDGKIDVFDLSTFEEGAKFEGVVTELPVRPITSVKRENGILFVKLLKYISPDATEEEKKPTWQGVSS